jgi:hypothetical protein
VQFEVLLYKLGVHKILCSCSGVREHDFLFVRRVDKALHSLLLQGVNLHFADTFLEEAGPFSVTPEAAPLLLEPFLRVLSHSVDKTLLARVESAVFGALMDERKESGEGLLNPFYLAQESPQYLGWCSSHSVPLLEAGAGAWKHCGNIVMCRIT